MSGVVLVCMPFGPVFSPSIGLSLLKAQLARQGIPSRVRYFSLEFAQRVGQAFYCGVASEGKPPNRHLAGEWIFSRALFGDDQRHGERYVEDVLLRLPGTDGASSDRPVSRALLGRILRARAKTEDFLQWCLQEILRERPRIVGFTSVFQQHVASLALARRIKQALPDTFIVMGGANCEDVMGAETVRQFPFVDAAVSGEADLVFPDLVRRVLEGQPVSGLPGVRRGDSVAGEFARGEFSSGPMVRRLDDLPQPDYDDYFEQFGASRYHAEWQPSLFFETSRGCWWGERMHCTFCGLNGTTMAYRSKSAARAIEELADLSRRHPGCDVQVTDNILDMGYFQDFLPALASRGLNVDLLYETKSNLKKEHVRKLRAAGIRRIQPGIESFSDAVLKLMRKGVSGLQNIQLLKWCKEAGVRPYWNFLWGFPGEPPEEYARMAELVPLLTHLEAPKTFGDLRLDRFSPNFSQAELLGFADVTPMAPYRHIYPLPEGAVANLAYYFTFRYREARDVDGYSRPLARELRLWQKSGEVSDLFSVDMGSLLLVWDLRPACREPLTVIRDLDRRLYQACDAACDLGQLADAAGAHTGSAVSAAEIEERLDPLLARGLLVRAGSRYLSLAIPLGDYSPPPAAVERLYAVAKGLGKRRESAFVVPLGDARQGSSATASGGRARPVGRKRTRRSRAGVLHPSHFAVNERAEVVIRLSPP